MANTTRPGHAAPLAPTLAMLAVFMSACASHPPDACLAGERPAVMDALYFGTATPDGTVTAADWRAFVDRVVTSRFPRGLSWWAATGQWQAATGALQRETAYILQLIHEDLAESEPALREIMNRYKTRFRQEAVLRVRSSVCVSF